MLSLSFFLNEEYEIVLLRISLSKTARKKYDLYHHHVDIDLGI